MTRCVALLRGVNVGGRQKIAMADLRAAIIGLGHREVSTYLQSGNAVFAPGTARGDPDGMARDIEAALEREFGLSTRVVVRDGDDVRRVVEANPLAGVATDPARLLVTFLSRPVDPDRLAGLVPATYAPDLFRAGEREVYVWCPEGVRNTRLTHAFFEKVLNEGVVATARNWNTVTKLLALLS